MKITCIEPIGISQSLGEQFIHEIQKLGFEFIQYPNRPSSDQEAIERIKYTDILLVSNFPLSANILANADNLKMISVAFTGVDHIDIDHCKQHSIAVSNAAGYSTQAVAELAIGLSLDVYRKLNDTQNWLNQGYDRKGFLGRELCGKTVGILGTGAIGIRTAKLFQAFGSHVIAWSRSKKEQLEEVGIRYFSLDEIIEKSDILSVHLPLNSETENLISAERLNKMKPEAIIINTARGKIIDNQALANALQNNTIAGAGIDVYETEPPLPANHPLRNAPNCVCIPHIGFATKEAIEIRAGIVLDNIRCWIAGNQINKIV